MQNTQLKLKKHKKLMHPSHLKIKKKQKNPQDV